MKRTKMTWKELESKFWKFNKERKPEDKPLTGYIVYKASNWSGKEYPEKSRTYRISSNNKAFMPKISKSLFGYCLDGTDQGVRLDWYNWDIEYCYM